MDTDSLIVLIIEREQEFLKQIVDLIQSNFSVEEIITASGTNEAIFKIINSSPDLILISYPLDGETEKELYELIRSKLPDSVIAFISETKSFARKAIQCGVYNYILKSAAAKEIETLIINTSEKKQANIKNRLEKVVSSNPAEIKLKFLTANGFIILNPDEVVFCKAAGYHTELCLINNRIEIGHQTLIKFEEKMTPFGFIRISRTHLINAKFIKRIFKKANILTLFANGTEHEIKVGKAQLKTLDDFNDN